MKRILVILVFTSVLTTATADDEPFTLVCFSNVGNHYFSDNYNIDESKQTVNGHSAKFTVDIIGFDLPYKNGDLEHWLVNRITGDFMSFCDPCAVINGRLVPTMRPMPIVGKCESQIKALLLNHAINNNLFSINWYIFL